MAKKTKNVSKGYTSDDFRAVAASVRTLWMANRKVPSLDEIDAVCDRTKGVIAKVISTEEFLSAMDITGVPVRKSKGLSAPQHYLLMVLTNPTDKRSLGARLKDARVSDAQYRAWMRNPIFASFIEQFAERALGDHLHVAHNSLMNQVEKGHVGALQFYYELTGRYNPRQQAERDIQSVLAQVIEVIQRNVTDPTALANIAEGIRDIMGGGVGDRAKEVTAYRSEQVEDAEVVYEEPHTLYEESTPLYEEPLTLEEKLASGGAAVDNAPSFMYLNNTTTNRPQL